MLYKNPHKPESKRLFPFQRLSPTAWLRALCDPRSRLVPGAVLTSTLPGDWATQPVRNRFSYQTNYLFYAPEARLECRLAARTIVVAPRTLLWLPPHVEYHLRLLSKRAHEPLLRMRFQLFRRGKLLGFANDALCVENEVQFPAWLQPFGLELTVPGPWQDERLRAHLALLTTHVLRWVRERDGKGLLTRAQRERLLLFASRRTRERPAPADLAAHLNLSPAYFTRLFKRTYGRAPREWLLDERMRAAAQRLQECDLTVGAIAREFGYAEPFLFSRQFKAAFGVGPRAYRRG